MEIWKNIASYEGKYQVSNLGRVKSLPRIVVQTNKKTYPIKERILTLSKETNGYIGVTLNDNGKKRFLVHRLVAQAFLCNPLNLPQVNHKDLDKTNNKADNLEWMTKSENQIHYLKNKC